MDKDNDFRFVSSISSSLNARDRLLKSGVFSSGNNPLFKSALIELLILARDLTFKAYSLGNWIDFKDDVKIVGKVTDVTMLIKYARDAACHIDSDNHVSVESQSVFTFNVIYGKGTLGIINDVVFESDYDDDICIFFGDQKIYLARHILRAINEAESFFKGHYQGSQFEHFLS